MWHTITMPENKGGINKKIHVGMSFASRISLDIE
jgi:hypothetical protein